MFFLFQLLLQCFFISITKYILITFRFWLHESKYCTKMVLKENGMR